MGKLKHPIRMCIACKVRLPQSQLLRIQVREGKFCSFSGRGRSFYVCTECTDKNTKRLKKALYQKCNKIDKDVLDVGKMVKEISTNG